MTHTIQHAAKATDWFEDISQQLEVLRADAANHADKDEIVPPDCAFDKVKNQIQNIRQLAGFPTVPVPDVWLGPGGEIGLTWDNADRSFDLIFGPKKLTARLTVGFKQQIIEHKDVPTILCQFAA